MSDARVIDSRVPSVPFLPVAIVGVVHLVAILLGMHELVVWTKPLLMPALAIGLVWAAPRFSGAVLLGLVALLLSCAGDVTLRWFVIGLGCFLLAHVAYLVLFVRHLAVGRMPRWVFLYAVWFVVLLAILVPHTGSLVVPVVLYGAVLCTMAVVAARCGAVVAWGGALFVASDSLLSVKLFLPEVHLPLADFCIMATYTVAQTLIVIGLVRYERMRSSAQHPAVSQRAL